MLVNDDIHTLSMAVSGIVAAPDSPGFAEETFAYNAATVHRPDVVLGAADAQDVAAGVRWAAERRLPVSVQSTGHGADSAVDGGLLINTRRLQELRIDPVERTARVGAGVKWRSVLEASVPHGLIGLHGSSTDVGVVGYTVGGGLPVLGRAHGFAADHVRSMEVVTADGALRRIDAEAEAELFALMCGGKGNFGIVTALEFSLSFRWASSMAGGSFTPGRMRPSSWPRSAVGWPLCRTLPRRQSPCCVFRTWNSFPHPSGASLWSTCASPSSGTVRTATRCSLRCARSRPL